MNVKTYNTDLANIVLEEINSANSMILIAASWLTDTNIIYAITKKILLPNFKIIILLANHSINKSNARDFEDFIKYGGELYYIGLRTRNSNGKESDTTRIAQNFCIIDDSTVITGTYNWKNTNAIKNESIIIIKNSLEEVTYYKNIFTNTLINTISFKLSLNFKANNQPINPNQVNIDLRNKLSFESIHTWWSSLGYTWKEIINCSFINNPLYFRKLQNKTCPEKLETIEKENTIALRLPSEFHYKDQTKPQIIFYINSLEPLQIFNNLEKLSINHFCLISLNFVSKLQKLTWLSATNNNLTEIDEITHLHALTELRLDNNIISKIPYLPGALSLLDIENNPVSELEFLINTPNLTTLNIIGTNITDYSNIKLLKNIKHLHFSPANDEQLNTLPYLAELESITIKNSSITNCGFLSKVPNIQRLHFENTNYNLSFNGIERLIELRTLTLIESNIPSNSSIRKLYNLIEFNAFNCKITSLDFIANNYWIEILRIGSNNLTTIEPIKKLINLKHLDISNNPIKDKLFSKPSISNLVFLSSLEIIDISDTQISNIEALYKLPKLKQIFAIRTKISNNSIEKLLRQNNKIKISSD